MIFHKSLKYYQEKVRIDKKANQSTAYKIQVYNNAKVDELVKKYNEGETVNIKTPPSALWAELAIINKPEVYKNYNKIINSKYTSNDNMDKLIIKNKANKDLNRIVEAEVERISKNLDYVNQVMQKYDIPQKQYEEFKRKQKNNSIANRQEILKQVAIKNNEILTSEGLNIPSNIFTYRNIEATAENLLRQSQMTSKHEEVNAINQKYLNDGKDIVYKGKEWIWTGAGKTTRHRSNHLQKRAVNEPFIIVNDKTLHIDEMMYPNDPSGSFSNAFICYCEVEYLTDYDEYKENLFGLHPTTYKPTTTYKSPTFAKTLKPKPKPLQIISPAGVNINSTMILNVGEPIIKPIDVNIDGIESVPHNYLIDGNIVEIIYNNGKYYYNGLELKEYDLGTKIGKVSKSAVTKHNANINNKPKPVDTTNIEVVNELPKKEFIDVSMLEYDDDMDAYIVTEFDDIKEFNGKYYYQGLELDYYDLTSKSGFILQSKVMDHNNEYLLGSSNKPKEKPKQTHVETEVGTYIPYDMFEKGTEPNTFIITDETPNIKYGMNGITVNGLLITRFDEYGRGILTKAEIDAHNKKVGAYVDNLEDSALKERINHLTEDEAKNMSLLKVAEHYDVIDIRNHVDVFDGREYMCITQYVTNGEGEGREFNIYFDLEAYIHYDRIKPSVIVNEVFKIPESLRFETREIWFKDNEDNISRTDDNTKYKTMPRTLEGVNWRRSGTESQLEYYDDANHRIIINSNFFKKRKLMDETWYDLQDVINVNDFWKFVINHEFVHSGDMSEKRWNNHIGVAHSNDKEYINIKKEEPSFTRYGNSKISEDYAEHGGYVSFMEANPNEHDRKMQVIINGETRRITYKEYKELYPKHYKYFMKKLYQEGF